MAFLRRKRAVSGLTQRLALEAGQPTTESRHDARAEPTGRSYVIQAGRLRTLWVYGRSRLLGGPALDDEGGPQWANPVITCPETTDGSGYLTGKNSTQGGDV